MTLFYVPLEPYQARYTLQLRDWNEAEFKRLEVPYRVVEGTKLFEHDHIVTGQVLDAHGRSYFALSQTMELVKMLSTRAIGAGDHIFFEDMFHPGIEAIPYILAQQKFAGWPPHLWLRCLAQTIDPDDFVNKTNMDGWMRHYEHMVSKFCAGIFCASEEMVPFIKVAGWTCPLYVTGLPFNSDEVKSRAAQLVWSDREPLVVWAARWDEEKQPHFFMELVSKYFRDRPNSKTRFVVCSGSQLRSNRPVLVHRAHKLAEELGPDRFLILEKLEKNEYYRILASARVLFNSALQDWVSNTLSEASALGCAPLYPAYRSFPEALLDDPQHLYVPWSIDEAISKMEDLLDLASAPDLRRFYERQDRTIEKTISIIRDEGGAYSRNHSRYRSLVRGVA